MEKQLLEVLKEIVTELDSFDQSAAARAVPDPVSAATLTKVKSLIAAADGCRCEPCQTDGPHASDCAVHNPPAAPIGACDCGATTTGRWADVHSKSCPAVAS